MKGKIFAFGTMLAVALALGAPTVLAQVTETDVLQQLRADIQADRQAVVAANLGLTDVQGAAFWPVYREYRAEMGKVGDRLQKLIQEYSKVFESVTEEQAKGMVDEMLAIGRDDLKVREAYLPRFRKVLPETKVARFLQIENKIDAVIKVQLADIIPLAKAAKK
ncbi:MAG: hypothetical protein MUF10_03315 [Thermoanaerobaculaceae bacterium]|jgi:hypothetical protein|nr:hypothetical protein [Thermoanaerobaculaceae bacterium]